MLGSSYFSMQVARATFEGDPVQEDLRRLVRRTLEPRAGRLPDKRDIYTSAAAILESNVDSLAFGVWDYWNEPSKVTAGFQDWVDGLQGREARKEIAPPDETHYLVFTVALLMKKGSNTDVRMQAVCNVSEGKLWRRKTFQRIISQGLRGLNFAMVRSDVMYMYPNDPRFAMTLRDLQGQDFHYLRRIED